MQEALTGGTTQARGMAASLLKYANREKVAQALTSQGYSVTRMTVNRWARGSEMPEIAARMIGELFGHADTKKEAPPWAEPLLADVPAIRQVVESNADELSALRAVLESMQGLLGPSDDDPVDGPPLPGKARKRGR